MPESEWAGWVRDFCNALSECGPERIRIDMVKKFIMESSTPLFKCTATKV